MDTAAKAREDLAQAFHAVGDSELEAKAREGYFGDFTSPLAMPINTLVRICREKGYDNIAERAMGGDFDG